MIKRNKNSKLIALIISLMLLFSATPAFAAVADADVHFSVPEISSAAVGDSITIPISIQLPATYEQSITGFGIRLNYDIEDLELTGVSVGDAQGMLPGDIDSNYSLVVAAGETFDPTGYLQLSYAAVGQGLTADGVVYNATFKVLQRPTSGSTTLTLTLRTTPPGDPIDYNEAHTFSTQFVNGVVNIPDNEAPQFAAGYPMAGSMQSDGSRQVRVTINAMEPVYHYFVLLPDNSLPAPSSTQVVNGQDGSGQPALKAVKSESTKYSSSDTGTLAPLHNTDYDIYVVIKDDAGNLSLPAKVDVKTPLAADFFAVGYPIEGEEQDPGSNQIEILVKTQNTENNAIVHYVAVLAEADAPTIDQIGAGKDSTGNDALLKGNITIPKDTADVTRLLLTLPEAETDYVIYLVAGDTKWALPSLGECSEKVELEVTTPRAAGTAATIEGVTVAGETAIVDLTNPTIYNVELPIGTILANLAPTDIVVTATDSNATVGAAATNDGGVTWTVVVTAEDGTKSVTYTIKAVVLQPSSNNDLGSLTLKNTADNQPISLSFDPATTSYDILVPYTTQQVTITATVADPTATLLINGMQSPATITLSQISPQINSPSVVVTAQNGDTKTYTLNITRTAPSSAKSITGFNFASPAATGTIDEGNHTIVVAFPFGTDVTALIPTISLTEFSTVEPASGVAQDFTNPVTYTVTAQDDTNQVYTVTVTVAPASLITLNNITGLKPVRSATPVTEIETDQFTGTVTWDPAIAAGGKFAANTVYYAQINITPKTGWTLEGLANNFFTVADAEEIIYNISNPGSFEAKFPKTAAASGGGGGGVVTPTVTGVAIKAAPDKVAYTEGDALDLSGLIVTLTYSNGTTKDIALANFADNKITVSPKAGDVLDAGDKEIVITVNGKTVKQAITVNKKETVPPPVEETVLTDIDGHWAQANIEYLVGIGAVAGYPDETFRPDSLITRAEFAKIIVDAFELTAESGKIFADTADHWAKDYVAIAAANGIVLGYNDQEFGPDDLITREQMAIMIVKAAGLTEATGELSFTDKDEVSSWAYDWVVSATQNKIMSGYTDNTFKPLNNATRAEAATVIYNVLMK